MLDSADLDGAPASITWTSWTAGQAFVYVTRRGGPVVTRGPGSGYDHHYDNRHHG